MNKIFVVFICIFGLSVSNAQIHEIGVFAGGSNFIGDVGRTNYIRPNELAYGILYKWNRSPRHSWRFSYTQSKLTANDLDSDMQARKTRGYNFENHVKEFSAGLEFNFFDFNLHEGKKLVTPYVFSGLNYFIYEELYQLDGYKKDYRAGSFAIPMVVGVKSNIAENWVLGLEVGARWTFTDNLDGSNPKNENLTELKFGNINNKDWYMFSGLTLTYTFGNKPCYCAD
ncbi:hypothetical protein HUK80_12065 [Flavobacterium sp. MAH-1]|uniref:DUF6089 domain-containing protein n=1 Tax=Flavobacterium agri TaxID=2743471 RepID=A0A7Y8Y383_9FLAO|nr:DUF6089 family protein [Flavobacterium agri]NUY81637.1 hypothetical protein [Flavobacterium agri]NYA71661.1 hypothetical protein [Flavobacterium agri]